MKQEENLLKTCGYLKMHWTFIVYWVSQINVVK